MTHVQNEAQVSSAVTWCLQHFDLQRTDSDPVAVLELAIDVRCAQMVVGGINAGLPSRRQTDGILVSAP